MTIDPDIIRVICEIIGAMIGLLTVWWRIRASIESRFDSLRKELTDHKQHVAETYTTKGDLLEATGRIMDAIAGVGSAVATMSQRIDRMIDAKPAPRARTT